MFDAFKRAWGGGEGGGGEREAEALAELERVREDLGRRRDQLEEKRRSRLDALFPQGPVAGAGPGRYPGLDPVNFEETEPQSWLVTASTGVIDNFPGGETLLSQLDATFRAFSDANHFRIVRDGPYGDLITWQREIFDCWDLDADVPVYVSNGGGARVLGCKTPLVVLDRLALDVLDAEEQRFLLATCLGHVYFGNLRIFAFYRLMEMLDKLPNVTGLLARGIGVLIPQISRGIELARSLNQQLIRKTNLVVGQRQHVLCDRLASLAMGSGEPAQRYFQKTALGGPRCLDEGVRGLLIEQGRALQEQFEGGDVDLTMLSIVGPSDPFAALRAYKLDAWLQQERGQKIAQGYYVTRDRLKEYRRTHQALEEELRFLTGRVLELSEREAKLEVELAELLARKAASAAAPPPSGPDAPSSAP